MERPLSLLLPLLACVWAANAPAQTIYRCQDAAGKPVYQQHACSVAGSAVELPSANVVPSQRDADLARAAALRRSGSVEQAIARGRVADGMTEAELRQALGEPAAVNSDRVAGKGLRQQWVYRDAAGGTRTVLLHDGVVVGEKTRQGERNAGQQRCPSAREIDNERVAASSTALTPEQRKSLLAGIQRMEACGAKPKRTAPG